MSPTVSRISGKCETIFSLPRQTPNLKTFHFLGHELNSVFDSHKSSYDLKMYQSFVANCCLTCRKPENKEKFHFTMRCFYGEKKKIKL